MFINYSYEHVQVKDLNPAFNDPRVLAGNPLLADSLLIGEGGKRTISKIGPSYVYNTVDHPIFPTAGRRFTLSTGLRRASAATPTTSTRGSKAICYIPHTRRTSIGFRVGGRVHPAVRQHHGAADLQEDLPWRRVQHSRLRHPVRVPARPRLRRPDRRQQEPAVQRRVPDSTSPGRSAWSCSSMPARCATSGIAFAWKEPITEQVAAGPLFPPLSIRSVHLQSPLIGPSRRSRRAPSGTRRVQVVDRGGDPVLHAGLNVPFRLIFAMNPSARQRARQQPEPREKFKFRFAVGSTF